ncbi:MULTISPECIES: GtrA family protein [Corynebacterium]|uniref:Flippase GtrA n=1 Tax=Corynebacterium freneyi TaxID=134034 RepID=A0ABS4UBB9_9CORY|nr:MULTISPECIES: GtrA family protein [Corynebacterium]MBP2333805.1 putative flippase GtrA [Corynebacterium freneyi]WJZ04092.1 GtrA-like protein [Corynebacterium freneyi]
MHKAHDDSTSENRDDRAAEPMVDAPGVRAEKSASAPLSDKPRDDHGLMVQMMRFIISGVIAAVVDFGTLIILNWGLGVDRTLSKAVSWVLGTITAYMINRRWTFKAEASGKRLAAVAVLYLTTFAVQNVIFWAAPFLLVDQWGWGRGPSDTVAFVVAQGVATVVNFIVQRTVIFKVK